jgi:hypothetical protein
MISKIHSSEQRIALTFRNYIIPRSKLIQHSMSDDIVSGNPNIGAASPFLQLARKGLPHINSPLLLIALTL